MALHAREMVRCASTALARQLQVCARLRPTQDSALPPTQLSTARGVSNLTQGGRLYGRGGTIIVDTEGSGVHAAEISKGEVRNARANFLTPAKIMSQTRRFLPENARESSRKAAQGPMCVQGATRHKHTKAGELGALTRKNNNSRLSPLSGEALKREAGEHKIKRSKSSLTTRGKDGYKTPKSTKVKKKSETEVTSTADPMSKLAKDINQWFNQVIEHLAEAEKAAASGKGGNSKAKSGSVKQATKKQKQPVSKSKPITSTLYEKGTFVPPTPPGFRPVPWASSFAIPKIEPASEVKPWRPEPPTAWGSEKRPIMPRPSSEQGYLDLQLSVLNGEIARQHDRTILREEVHNSPYDKPHPAEKMLEIRPSLVENSDHTTHLATAGSWLPYGAPKDNINHKGGILNFKNTSSSGGGKGPKSGSRLAVNTTTGLVASNLVPGISRHQLTKEAASAASTGLKENSPKGFILLNDHEKQKEKIKNSAQLSKSKTNQADIRSQQSPVRKPSQTVGSSLSSSFILVDPPPKARQNRILLSDNPHTMAAEKTRKVTKPKQTLSTISFAEEAINKLRPKNQSSSIGNSNVKGPIQDEGTKSTERVRRWAEQVEKTLAEFNAAKREAIKKQSLSNQKQVKPVKSSEKINSIKNAAKDMVTNKSTGERFFTGPNSGVKPLSEQASVKKTSSKQAMGFKAQSGSASMEKPIKSNVKPVTSSNTNSTQTKEEQDREYESRLSQFINMTNGRSVEEEALFAGQLFGPLTLEQHMALHNLRNPSIGERQEKSYVKKLSSPQHNKREMSSPKATNSTVHVKELTPDVKKVSKKNNKSEEKRKSAMKEVPTLRIMPEEMAKTKKGTSKISKSSLEHGVNQSKTSKPTSSPPVTGYDISGQELWANMLTTRMDQYRAMVELSSRESNKASRKTNSQTSLKPVNPTDNKTAKPSSKLYKESNKKDIKQKPQQSGSQKSKSLTLADGNSADAALSNFRDHFLKLQHERLIRSQKTKTQQEKTKKGSVTTSPPPAALPSQSTQSAKYKSKSLPSSSERKTSKTQVRGSPISKSETRELDPFESWVQSMEKSNFKPTKYGKNISKTDAKPVPHPYIGSINKNIGNADTIVKPFNKTAPVAKEAHKKKYPRFEAKPESKVAQDIYRDMRATYAIPSLNQDMKKINEKLVDVTQKSPSTRPSSSKMSADQLFNQIKSATKPLILPSHGGVIGPATRPNSAIFNSARLGGLTNSASTKHALPPSPHNMSDLFKSLDGFMAMEAVPVLEGSTSSSSKSPVKPASVKTSAESVRKTTANAAGDSFNDMRAILAREREMAAATARRRLIEHYEKNIEKYERSLETYRSKLRHARQASFEAEVKSSKSERSNPRKHPEV